MPSMTTTTLQESIDRCEQDINNVITVNNKQYQNEVRELEEYYGEPLCVALKKLSDYLRKMKITQSMLRYSKRRHSGNNHG